MSGADLFGWTPPPEPTRAEKRQADDYYPTPAWLVRHFLEETEPGQALASDLSREHRPGCLVVDVCAGRAELGQAIEAALLGWDCGPLPLPIDCDRWEDLAHNQQRNAAGFVRHWYRGIELHNGRAGEARRAGWAVYDADATDTAAVRKLFGWGREDGTRHLIANPPYGGVDRVVRCCLELLAPGGVAAILLPMSFLEGQKRAAFLRENPPDVYVSPRRPSFVGGGTDMRTVGWFVWERLEGVWCGPNAGQVRWLKTEGATR